MAFAYGVRSAGPAACCRGRPVSAPSSERIICRSISPRWRMSHSTGELRRRQRAQPARAERLPEHDLRHIVLPRDPQNRFAHFACRRRNDFRAELPRQREMPSQPGLLLLARAAPGASMYAAIHDASIVRREPPRVADELFRERARAHRHEQPVARLPRPGDALLPHHPAQVAIHVLGHDAQRHLAQAP